MEPPKRRNSPSMDTVDFVVTPKKKSLCGRKRTIESGSTKSDAEKTTATSTTSPVFSIFGLIDLKTSRDVPSTSQALTTTSNPLLFPKKVRLVSLEEMKADNCKKFMHFFKQTWKTRDECKNCGFEKSWLPSVPHFEKEFYQLMNASECGLIRKMRISNVTADTLRRAAASAVFFLVFAKQDTMFDACREYETFASDVRTTLMQMTVERKCEVIAKFVVWYDSMPPLRVSTRKIIASKLVEARAHTMEEGTLRTVCRGLLSYFTYVAIIQPSASKAPTDESRRYWACINTTLTNCKIRKGGSIDLAPASISLHDLKTLMQNGMKAESTFEIQSWLLAIVLGGTGLRIGSIRNQWKKGFSDQPTQAQHPTKREMESWGSDKETDPGECDSDDETTLDVSFDCIKANDVVVYRVPSFPNDPENTVRLRVELSIHSTKTTGQNFFAPQKNGFWHPTVDVDGSLDWGISVALALTLLSVLCGSTECSDVVQNIPQSEGETCISKQVQAWIPLFRSSDCHQRLMSSSIRSPASALKLVADRLQIPATLFPSRAYRCGFAKSIVEGIVNRGDPNRIVTLEEIRSSLLTSSRWRSNQVDRYLATVTKSVLIVGQTDIGIAARDWKLALKNSSIRKSSYRHINQSEIYNHLLQQSNNKNEFVHYWEALNRTGRRSLMDTVNYDNWINASSDDAPSACSKTVLDVACAIWV